DYVHGNITLVSNALYTRATNLNAAGTGSLSIPDYYGLVDDGGVGHTFRDVQINGCTVQVRLAGLGGGYAGLDGFYVEGAPSTGRCFDLNSVTLDTGLSAGGSGLMYLANSSINASSARCIDVTSGGAVLVNDVFTGTAPYVLNASRGGF